MSPRQFTRRPAPDPRDQRYLIQNNWPQTQRPLTLPLPVTRKLWDDNYWWGDQGNTPQCVAYAWNHWLADAPVVHSINPVVPPQRLYESAKRLDEWPGENYDGTSVRGGVKALQAAGWVSSYWWTWDVNVLANTILTIGPVVLGTDWFSGMMTPDRNGRVSATGRPVGGHAYVLNGVDTTQRLFRIKNSWGRSWGQGGHAWIGFTDTARLLARQGEACIATERTDQQNTIRILS